MNIFCLFKMNIHFANEKAVLWGTTENTYISYAVYLRQSAATPMTLPGVLRTIVLTIG